MSGDASTGVRRRRLRDALAILGLLVGRPVRLVFQQVLGITQRPSWPPPAGSGDALRCGSGHGGVRRARRNVRPHDAALDFAWSTAATDRAVGRGKDLLPAHLRRRRGSPLVGAHPHVRLAGGRGRDGDGRTARAEAGRRRRGARDRRRLRLEALRRRRGDVQAARGRRRADRRQRRRSRSTATGCTRTTGGWTGVRTRSAAPTTASSTSSTARSPGPAARGSRTTSRTAASTT